VRLPQITKRRIMVSVSIVAFVIAAWILLSWYGARLMLRSLSVYNTEMRQLNHDYEVKLRGAIVRLLRSRRESPDGRESADRVFEMLHLSRVARNSREVQSWERAPHSPERTEVALKWARVAADEAAYEAALHRRWERDYGRGRLPHHITDDEVPPFKMPADWTEDDLINGRAERDK